MLLRKCIFIGWKNQKYLKLEEKVNKKLSNEDNYSIKVNEYEKMTSDVLPVKSGKSYIEHKSALANYFRAREICITYYPARIEFSRKKD